MKSGSAPLTFLTCAFSVLATFAALTPRAEAKTTLTATFSGTFVREYGDPDTDLALGDKFRFSITFDDSQIDTSASFRVNSILSSEFLVNGVPHPHTAPIWLGLSPDIPEGDLPGAFIGFNPETGPNSIFLDSMRLSPIPFTPTPNEIGLTTEFSDFLLYNGYNSTSYNGLFSMSDPFTVITGGGNSIHGEITLTTVTVVPEPAVPMLTGLATLGAFLLPRRRK